MSSTNNQTQESNKKGRQNNTGWSPFDDLAQEYDAWFDEEGSLIFFIEVQALKGLFPSLPRPWIEVGVGSGRFAQALGIETGVDPSSELRQMARRRGINVFLGRGDHKFFRKGSFGTVYLIVTLCFLDSPLSVLREARRILAPGGKLVLGLVLKESPWGEFYELKKEEGHRFYKYATFYRRDEVIVLIAQAGFTTEKIVSTLFQRPNEVQYFEESREGYFPDAGFTIIVAGKGAAEPESKG